MPYVIGFIIVAVYVGFAWKFWQGYRATNFQPGFVNRLLLSASWLPLVIVNKSYRKNFQKALKSGK